MILTTLEIIGLVFVAILPMIILNLVQRDRLMRFFFPQAGWYREATTQARPSTDMQPPGMLYLVPFKADRLPASMREVGDEKKTYADMLDVIKAHGGMSSWIQEELSHQLEALGCRFSTGAEGGVPASEFVLSGELLTTVRAYDMSQIALKVTLSCGRQKIYSKLYSATSRDPNANNLTQALGLDSFIRPPYAGLSNRKTNRLLTQAMGDVMQQLAADLSRVLPYLGRPNQVQYAG